MQPEAQDQPTGAQGQPTDWPHQPAGIPYIPTNIQNQQPSLPQQPTAEQIQPSIAQNQQAELPQQPVMPQPQAADIQNQQSNQPLQSVLPQVQPVDTQNQQFNSLQQPAVAQEQMTNMQHQAANAQTHPAAEQSAKPKGFFNKILAAILSTSTFGLTVKVFLVLMALIVPGTMVVKAVVPSFSNIGPKPADVAAISEVTPFGTLDVSKQATSTTNGSAATSPTTTPPAATAPAPAAAAAAASSCLAPEYQAALDKNWAYTQDWAANSMKLRFERGDNYTLYDTQTVTNNLLDMAIKCHRTDYIDKLASIYLIAYDYLYDYTVVNGKQVKYADGHREWHCTTSNCVNWATNPYKENAIVSSQYIYLISRTINAIAHLPAAERTANMKSFVSKYFTVVHKDHLNRWIWATPSFTGFGAPCNDNKLQTHLERMTSLNNWSYSKAKSYCNAVLDKDLWILASAVEISEASATDPKLVAISPYVMGRYKSYINLGISVINSGNHFKQVGKITNYRNQAINIITIDPGVMRDHPDYAYAGYSGSATPVVNNPKYKIPGPATLGWDVSHFRRLVHVLATLYEKKAFTGSTFPSDSFMKAMGYQVSYVAFKGNFDQPLMTNFIDGTNGWYRVGYAGNPGIGPYELSKSYLTAGYGFWANNNDDLKRLMATGWNKVKNMPTTDPNYKYFGFNSDPVKSPDYLMTLPTLMYTSPSYVTTGNLTKK